MGGMSAVPRVDVGGQIFHAYNRGNAGGQLFVADKDYSALEHILVEAKILTQMRILAYCIMPNHWHFVVQPVKDGDMGEFFHKVTVTHAKRWHTVRGSTGQGHIYQGTYKSNLCESGEHFLRLVRYVERNAARAKLVDKAENWRWGSAWIRLHGTEQQKKLLSEWPMEVPDDYYGLLNEPEHEEDLGVLRNALRRGCPYGSDLWTAAMIDAHHLESTTRARGRPRRHE
jgi:putative transposase